MKNHESITLVYDDREQFVSVKFPAGPGGESFFNPVSLEDFLGMPKLDLLSHPFVFMVTSVKTFKQLGELAGKIKKDKLKFYHFGLAISEVLFQKIEMVNFLANLPGARLFVWKKADPDRFYAEIYDAFFKSGSMEKDVSSDDYWFQNLFFLIQTFDAIQKKELKNVQLVIDKVIHFFKEYLGCSDILILKLLGDHVQLYKNQFTNYQEVEADFFQQIEEVTRCLVYHEPVIVNKIDKKSNFSRLLKPFISSPRHAFIYPTDGLEGSTLIWVFTRDSGKPFKEVEFIWIQIVLNFAQFLASFLEVNYRESAKWSRLSMIKQRMTAFQQIFDAFKFGVMVLDKDFMVRLANRKVVEILNLKSGVVEGESMARLIDKDKFALIEKAISTNAGEYRGEFEYFIDSEIKRLIGFSVYPHVEFSGETFIIVLFKDISEEKEIELELLRMDRLSTLGIMASELAHEIRNPLAGIKAIAETFKDELEQDSPLLEYVYRILKQANRMDILLKGIFNYAKPARPHLTITNLDDLIRDTYLLLREKLRKCNIQFDYKIYPGANYIYVDPSQFQQVLMNVLVNAIESVEADGNIQLTARPKYKVPQKLKKYLNTDKHEKFIKISIIDDGAGIPDSSFPKLFLPFFTTKSQGIGLGLAIVYQLVKEHGGHVYFEEKVEKGAICNLIIPVGESNLL